MERVFSRDELVNLIAHMCEDAEQCYREDVAVEDSSNTDTFNSFYMFSSVIFNLICRYATDGGTLASDDVYNDLRLWEQMNLSAREAFINALLDKYWIDFPPVNENEELVRLRAHLHSRQSHPDWEYAHTHGPRKAFDGHKPEGAGWVPNIHMGKDGWERFDYHEEAYWMRPKMLPQKE